MVLVVVFALVVIFCVFGFTYVLLNRKRRTDSTDSIMIFVFLGFVSSVCLTMSIIFYIKSDFTDVYMMGIDEHVNLFEEVDDSGEIDNRTLLSALVFDDLYDTDMYEVLTSLDVDDSYLTRKRFMEALENAKDIADNKYNFIGKRDSTFRKLTNIYTKGITNLIRDDLVDVYKVQKEYEILAGKGQDFLIKLGDRKVNYRYMGEYDGELNFYVGKERDQLFAVKAKEEGALVVRNVEGNSMYELRVVMLYGDGSLRLDVKEYGLEEVKYDRYEELIDKYK